MEIDKSYRQELYRGAKIFEKSFEGIRGARVPGQKKAFEKAAKEALQGVHDAANALMRDELKKLDTQLHEDYTTYLANPTEENAKQVTRDIAAMKKSI